MLRKILLGALAVTPLACAPTTPKYTFKLPELHARLENGMRVIVLPDDTTDLVEVDVRYEVGSNEDPEGKAGLAHLVEHMMFQQRQAGADKPPFFTMLRERTLFFNAYTNNDTTHYMTSAPAEQLEELVSLEVARLHTGCETIPADAFEREREVVRNEIRQRLGQNEAQVLYRLAEDIYPKGHPYARLVGGDDQQLSNITLDDVCTFMKQYYVPERATLIIAGNVTEKTAQEAVGKWAAALPARAAAPRVPVPPLTLQKKRVVHELDVEDTTVYVAWALPPDTSEDAQASNFIMGSLAGRTGAFGATYEFAKDTGIVPLGGPHAPAFAVAVTLRDPSKIDEALEAIWKSAAGAHRGFEEGEGFEELRKQMIGNLVTGFEQLPARTNAFGEYAQFYPDGGYLGGELGRIGKIDGDKVRRVIKKVLDPEKAVVVIVKPKAGAGKYDRSKLKFRPKDRHHQDQTVDPADARRAVSVTPRTSVLAGARRFTLGNGMNVVLLPRASSLPVVSVRLVFGVGSAHESASSAGLAEAAASFLSPPSADAGSGGQLTSANVLGEVGARYGAYAGADSTTFVASGLELYLDVLIRGLERWITVGDYNQDSIERWQKQVRFALARKDVRAEDEYRRALARAIYGAAHPYGNTGSATDKTLGAIDRDVAYSFKKDHYTAKNATLVIAGKFDDARAESVIRDTFGEWSSGGRDAPVDAAPAGGAARYVGVVGDDSPSVEVTIAYPGPAGIDGGHAARLILSEMLNARMGVVRETLGASYGVYGGYQRRVGAGLYTLGGAIDAARAGEGVAAMRAGIESLRQGKDFATAFVKARREVLKNLLVESTDSSSLAEGLAMLTTFGLGADFQQKLAAEVAAMKPERVLELARRELAPDKESIVALGEKGPLEALFRTLGVTPTIETP